MLLGTVDKIAESLLRYREEFGLTYFTLFEWNVDAFAPVVEKLRDLA